MKYLKYHNLMSKPVFRKPHEMRVKKERKPVSARVTVEVKDKLAAAAEGADLSLGELVEQVLEDYVAWLEEQGPTQGVGKKRR